MAEQTLNVPQLVVFILVAVLTVRWYLKKPAGATAQPVPGTRSSSILASQVEQLARMFPQYDRRQLAWALQRQGGNVAVVTERILSGRALETPPPTFNPPLSPPAATARTAAPVAKPAQPDLITRYNLASKLNAASEATTTGTEQKTKAWSQDRSERQANLAKRREEMILAARKKLEAQEKGKGAAVS